MSAHSPLAVLICTLAAVISPAVWAASAAPAAEGDAPHSSAPDTARKLQEVTVTAQHPRLDGQQRNDLVQQAATYVQGISALENESDGPGSVPRWRSPLCPGVTGLIREQGEFLRARIEQIARAAGAPLAGKHCRPNLLVFVTAHPQELLRAMESRYYGVSFGRATPFSVDQFIRSTGAVKVWHNTYLSPAGWAFGAVYAVADQTKLHGLAQGQFADYVALVSLAEIKHSAHFGEAQTILRLFDGPPEAAPAGLSDWDQVFLKILYHPLPTLAKDRPNIAMRMIRDLYP
jgi:hypothetical protein